jgi:hypothetical protein
MSNKLDKIEKVNESFTVYRYDNGFMLEVGGRNSNEEWKTCKILCTSEEELISLIKEAITLPLES